MKPLGKAMKIGNMQNLAEQETLNAFLTSYRDDPHISTGIPPAHMLFRDGYRNNLPHQQTSDDKIRQARQTDSGIKKERKSTCNSSRCTVDMNYKIGDQALLRNYKKKSKFDPDYLPEKFVIMEVLAKGFILLVKSLNTDKCLMSHPNDAKNLKVTLPITMLFQAIQIITMIGKRRLNLYLTMTISTVMTLNKIITLPILLYILVMSHTRFRVNPLSIVA